MGTSYHTVSSAIRKIFYKFFILNDLCPTLQMSEIKVKRRNE